MGNLLLQVTLIFAVFICGHCWKLALVKWSWINRALIERWTHVNPFNNTSLNGEKILVETDLIYPYVLAYKASGGLIVSGFIGEIWKILEENLNFTSEYKLLDRDFEINESNVTLILTNAYPSSFNFRRLTVPLTAVWFHLYTKRVSLGDGLLSYSSSEAYLRNAIFALFVVFSTLNWTIKKNLRSICERGKMKEYKNNFISFSEALMDSLALMCSQGVYPQPLNTSFRLFNLTIMLFAVIVTTAFSATLISKLAGATNLKLDTLSKLVSTGDYTLCSSEVGMASSVINELRFHSIPSFPVEWLKNVNRAPCTSKKLEFVPANDYCLDKTVILEVFQVSNVRSNTQPGRCKIFKHPSKLFQTLLSLNVAEDFRYLEIFNRNLLRLKERGIVSQLQRKWLPRDFIRYPADEEVGLSFVEIKSVINVLVGGVALALVLFLLECLFYSTVKGGKKVLNILLRSKRDKFRRVNPPYVFVH